MPSTLRAVNFLLSAISVNFYPPTHLRNRSSENRKQPENVGKSDTTTALTTQLPLTRQSESMQDQKDIRPLLEKTTPVAGGLGLRGNKKIYILSSKFANIFPPTHLRHKASLKKKPSLHLHHEVSEKCKPPPNLCEKPSENCKPPTDLVRWRNKSWSVTVTFIFTLTLSDNRRCESLPLPPYLSFST